MRITVFSCIALLGISLFLGCRPSQDKDNSPVPEDEHGETLFETVDAAESGISFANELIENDTFNYHLYGYLYNGGGIGVIDYDNDGLWDLFFSGTQSRNTLYHNLGDGKFEDVTEKAGVQGKNALASGVTVVDANGDGLQDLYVVYSGPWEGMRITNELLINQGNGTFKDMASQMGLNDGSHTSQALWLDIDNDNDLDLYLVNHRTTFDKSNAILLQQSEDGQMERVKNPEKQSESDRLFLNTGNGNFKDITLSAGVYNNAFGLSALAIDINEDGLQDILVCNDFIEPDYMYVNLGNGKFEDRINANFEHMAQNSMGSDAADLNNDGLEEIVVVDMLAEPRPRRYTLETTMMVDRAEVLTLYGYKHQVMKNVLQYNLGNGIFSEIGEYAGIEATDWSWAPLMSDFNNDGLVDLFVSNGYRRDFSDSDYLKYVDENFDDGVSVDRSLRELFELVPINPISNYMYINQGDFRFKNMASAWGIDVKGFTNGAVVVDIDNDGDLDVFTNNVAQPASFFRNLASQKTDNKSLRVRLNGPKGNAFGTGSQVTAFTSEGRKSAVMRHIRGFFSSSEPVVHFGLGRVEKVNSVFVQWPDGKVTAVQNPEVDDVLVVDYADARQANIPALPSVAEVVKEVIPGPVAFTHEENAFVDVKREPLIPRPFSHKGPCIAEADFNGDDRADVFVGGARGQAGAIYLQDANGSFKAVQNPALQGDRDHEDTDAASADFNGDGNLDLYVASGGSSENEGSALYQDRIYFGNGNGTFTRGNLPAMATSTGAVAAADVDSDGDTDIFVGTYLIPNKYPMSGKSVLLMNNGGKFIPADIEGLENAMVSDADFADMDGDGSRDLIVVGEWMAPTVFLNRSGTLQKADGNGLGQYSGWWNALHVADIDNDGDLDIIGGNYGENSRFEASIEQPISVVANDFDRNGKYDAIVSMYFDGELYPVPRRDDLLGQIPSLKKKYTSYQSYSTAKVEDIFDAESMSQALRRSANTLASMLFINDGSGNFEDRRLPAQAQFFPVFAIETMDLNGDGHMDILIGGNDFRPQIETYRIDAGRGWVLLQKADGSFTAPTPVESGFNVPGEIRAIHRVSTSKGDLILVGRSDDALVCFEPVNRKQEM